MRTSIIKVFYAGVIFPNEAALHVMALHLNYASNVYNRIDYKYLIVRMYQSYKYKHHFT